MNKLILGMVIVAMLIAFSAPVMGVCNPGGVGSGTCPWGCGTSGTTNGTMTADGGEPCVNHFNNLDVGTIPAGATIKWARLYWHIWMQGSWTNVTFCNATGCTQRDFNLSLYPNCFQSQDWGFYRGGISNSTDWVYWNVTNLTKSGAHNVSMDNRPCPDGRCMQCYLVVVYEKDGYPTTSYWVNQGHKDLGVGEYTTYFNAPPAADDTTNGTLWQLGLAHNAKVEIWFNTNLVTTTYGGGACDYGELEEYEIPAGWTNSGGNSMTWKSWDDYYHPVLAMFMDQPVVSNITKSGGGGVKVRETWKIHQNKYSGNATDLHFKLWQKEDNIDVTGWDVTVSHFSNVNGKRGSQPPPHNGQVQNMPGLPTTSNPDNGNHAVDITAKGANIPFCTWVKVDATFWLTDWNTKRISNITWTNVSGVTPEKKAVPNHGWDIGWPTPDPSNPGQYLHEFTITNDDAVDTFEVSGLAFNATMDWYDDLDGISFPPYVNFTLAPGQDWSTTISTTGDMVGGHIYFTYSLNGSGSSDVISTDWVDHPVVGNSKIIVLKNSDFDVLVADGRATKVGDTYYIEDQTITNNMGAGVTIENTNVPFVIDNCTIHDCIGGSSGVFMNNVTGGTVINCTIHNNKDYGIELGMVSLDSTDPKFVNITCNAIYENGLSGLALIGFNCTVKCNTIRDNGRHGIYVFGNDSKIHNNTVKDNDEYGIKLYNSSGNYIYRNDISGNNGTGVQGYDGWLGQPWALNNWNTSLAGTYCYRYIPFTNLLGNHWADHTAPDTAPPNGIVDTSYAIDGEAGAVDSAPQVTQWWKCGDVNRNGLVNIDDGILIAGGGCCVCKWAADVDCNGLTNIDDGIKTAAGLLACCNCSDPLCHHCVCD